MRIKELNGYIALWLSANDTANWASNWPQAYIYNKRMMAVFDPDGDLVDLTINGKNGDCPLDEFNAICYDHIKPRFPEHNCIKNMRASFTW